MASLTGLLYPSLFNDCPDGFPPDVMNDLLTGLDDTYLDGYEEVLKTTLADQAFDFTTAVPGEATLSSDELRAFAAKTLEQIRQWRATEA